MTHSSNSSFLKLHHNTFQGTLQKAFSRSTKAAYIVFRFKRFFSYIFLRIKIGSKVRRPRMKANRKLSVSAYCLIMALTMCCRACIVYCSNFEPYPHVVVSPYPLKLIIILKRCHLSRICSSLIIRLIIHVITFSIASPPAFPISMTIPEETNALPSHILSISSAVISLVDFIAVSSTEASIDNELSSQLNSVFKSCS